MNSMGMTSTGVGILYGNDATMKGVLVIATYGAFDLETRDSDHQCTLYIGDA